ncbi:PIR protein [Plasmodium yoelii]|uniref:PIR protein n=2 Tax=Plasmodium yoelii TaxID=5861 RepID=A0AAE9WKJ4_PLAYO|nr:PIR protein [Plasmodium yoelii]WBY54651.1 PIR protein [Plasmodium yoelii yoelii]CDU16020.1 YIR protein [Plasmodium yoelii]VTZ71644.1 PIR protein [Plasmodium yoelii]|eukprot:XP_022810969.1 PIR protein [Plasmodium yoelii]
MDDTLCGKFVFLRKYLPDDSDEPTSLDFYGYESFKNYCPNANCNTELEKITIGFLWLLEQCYSESKEKNYDQNSINAFFIHMLSWFSYKLMQKSNYKNVSLNDFYNEHVKNSNKYTNFISAAYKIGDLKDFMDERNYLLNINIEDLSKFYDALKLICSMYGDITMTKHDTLPDNAILFVKKYQELTNNCKIEDTARSKIFSVLSTDYNNIKNKSTNITSLPEITANVSALSSGDTSSSSSITNKLLLVLSTFGAIAFFLGISYKYSLFGFRKRAQKQYLREKIKNIKKKMNR